MLVALAALLGLAVGPVVHSAASQLVRDGQVHVPQAAPGPAGGVDPAGGSGSAPALRLANPLRWRALAEAARRSPSVLVALTVLTAALYAGTAARIGADAALPAFLVLVAVGVTLTAVDVRLHRLPDALTLPSYPLLVLLLAGAALLGADSGSFTRALSGGAAMFLCYLALHLANPRGLGFGDVKLAGVLGLCTGWLGWGVWAVGIASASLFAGVFGLALLLLRRAERRSSVAMGPFLVLGALTAVLVGQQVADAYVAA